MMRLSPALQRKFDQLNARQKAAVTAYQETLNRSHNWMAAVIAALYAADMQAEIER